MRLLQNTTLGGRQNHDLTIRRRRLDASKLEPGACEPSLSNRGVCAALAFPLDQLSQPQAQRCEFGIRWRYRALPRRAGTQPCWPLGKRHSVLLAAKAPSYDIAVAYDRDAFIEDFLAAQPSAHVFQGFRISRVEPDRVRQALDVELTHDDGRALVLFLERRVPGREALATTEALSVSYYPSREVSDAEAAQLGRAFASFLSQREKALGPEAAQRTLRLGVRQGTPDRCLELRINRECNEQCVFCNTPEDSETILPGPAAIEDALRVEQAAGHSSVLFTGREPTLEPRLLGYVQLAKSLGYSRIRVQTNGTRLADEGFLRKLLNAGVTEFEISLHTLQVATFEQLVGKRSLLLKTEGGIGAVLRAGARLHLVTVATTQNLHELPDMLRTLGKRYAGRLRHLTLSPMAPVGDGEQRLDLIPRFSKLTQSLPKIVAAAREAQIDLEIPSRCGLPLCVTPPELRSLNLEAKNTPGLTLETGKHKPPQCSQCRFDAVCTGVWSAYLDRHGSDELVAVPAS